MNFRAAKGDKMVCRLVFNGFFKPCWGLVKSAHGLELTLVDRHYRFSLRLLPIGVRTLHKICFMPSQNRPLVVLDSAPRVA